MKKQEAKTRRSTKTRDHIRRLGANRLCVHRTPKHMYAQIIEPGGSRVITCASTLDKDIRSKIKYPGNVEAASMVGKVLAERAKAAGVTKVAFDRSGYKYHGRVRALAEAARENGMEF